MVKKGLFTLVAGAVLAFSPAVARAAGPGRAQHGAVRGDAHGHAFRGNEGHYRNDNFHGGRYFYGAPGYSSGFYGAPYFGYSYGPGYTYAPNPCGYYDQWGNWVPTPGCYVGPYGY